MYRRVYAILLALCFLSTTTLSTSPLRQEICPQRGPFSQPTESDPILITFKAFPPSPAEFSYLRFEFLASKPLLPKLTLVFSAEEQPCEFATPLVTDDISPTLLDTPQIPAFFAEFSRSQQPFNTATPCNYYLEDPAFDNPAFAGILRHTADCQLEFETKTVIPSNAIISCLVTIPGERDKGMNPDNLFSFDVTSKDPDTPVKLWNQVFFTKADHDSANLTFTDIETSYTAGQPINGERVDLISLTFHNFPKNSVHLIELALDVQSQPRMDTIRFFPKNIKKKIAGLWGMIDPGEYQRPSIDCSDNFRIFFYDTHPTDPNSRHYQTSNFYIISGGGQTTKATCSIPLPIYDIMGDVVKNPAFSISLWQGRNIAVYTRLNHLIRKDPKLHLHDTGVKWDFDTIYTFRNIHMVSNHAILARKEANVVNNDITDQINHTHLLTKSLAANDNSDDMEPRTVLIRYYIIIPTRPQTVRFGKFQSGFTPPPSSTFQGSTMLSDDIARDKLQEDLEREYISKLFSKSHFLKSLSYNTSPAERSDPEKQHEIEINSNNPLHTEFELSKELFHNITFAFLIPEDQLYSWSLEVIIGDQPGLQIIKRIGVMPAVFPSPDSPVMFNHRISDASSNNDNETEETRVHGASKLKQQLRSKSRKTPRHSPQTTLSSSQITKTHLIQTFWVNFPYVLTIDARDDFEDDDLYDQPSSVDMIEIPPYKHKFQTQNSLINPSSNQTTPTSTPTSTTSINDLVQISAAATTTITGDSDDLVEFIIPTTLCITNYHLPKEIRKDPYAFPECIAEYLDIPTSDLNPQKNNTDHATLRTRTTNTKPALPAPTITHHYADQFANIISKDRTIYTQIDNVMMRQDSFLKVTCLWETGHESYDDLWISMNQFVYDSYSQRLDLLDLLDMGTTSSPIATAELADMLQTQNNSQLLRNSEQSQQHEFITFRVDTAVPFTLPTTSISNTNTINNTDDPNSIRNGPNQRTDQTNQQQNPRIAILQTVSNILKDGFFDNRKDNPEDPDLPTTSWFQDIAVDQWFWGDSNNFRDRRFSIAFAGDYPSSVMTDTQNANHEIETREFDPSLRGELTSLSLHPDGASLLIAIPVEIAIKPGLDTSSLQSILAKHHFTTSNRVTISSTISLTTHAGPRIFIGDGNNNDNTDAHGDFFPHPRIISKLSHMACDSSSECPSSRSSLFSPEYSTVFEFTPNPFCYKGQCMGSTPRSGTFAEYSLFTTYLNCHANPQHSCIMQPIHDQEVQQNDVSMLIVLIIGLVGLAATCIAYGCCFYSTIKTQFHWRTQQQRQRRRQTNAESGFALSPLSCCAYVTIFIASIVSPITLAIWTNSGHNEENIAHSPVDDEILLTQSLTLNHHPTDYHRVEDSPAVQFI